MRHDECAGVSPAAGLWALDLSHLATVDLVKFRNWGVLAEDRVVLYGSLLFLGSMEVPRRAGTSPDLASRFFLVGRFFQLAVSSLPVRALLWLEVLGVCATLVVRIWPTRS